MAEIKQLAFADGVDVTPPTASDADVQKTIFDDDTTWDGSTATKTYDLEDLSSFDVDVNNVADATKAQWVFLKPSGDNYETMPGCVVTRPSTTTVKFTFGAGYEPAAGTYRILGIG